MPTLARDGWDQYLQSMLDQTVPADEFIVVVDRYSSDDEQQKLRARWPAVFFLFNEKNIGIAASLNQGLAKASGDIIFRADDDDRYHPNRIERQLACLQATGADIVGSWAEATNGAGLAPSYLIKNPADHEAIARTLQKRNIMIHPSLAFHKGVILAIGGYDETFLYAQDYALYLKALRSGLKLANVPEPLMHRSYSDQSITTKYRYQQLMFSCAVRIIDSAHKADRKAFFRAICQYALLAATPNWIRQFRRRVFTLIGSGI